MSELLDIFKKIGAEEPLAVSQLEEKMRDAEISNSLVQLLRFITSCEIQRRQDHFINFLSVKPISAVGYVEHDPAMSLLHCRHLVLPSKFVHHLYFYFCVVHKHPIFQRGLCLVELLQKDAPFSTVFQRVTMF